MRILLINSEYPPIGGGAGNASAIIARELAALGQDICVLTTSFDHLAKDERTDNVRIVRVRSFRRRADRSSAFEQSVFMVASFFGMLRLFKQWKPDVILAFFGIPAGVTALGARWLFKIPYVVSLRGGDVPGFRPYDFGTYHRMIAPLLRRVWKHAAAIVANSAGLRALALNFEKRYPIAIIPNGVDVGRFNLPRDRSWNPPRMLFVGRLVYQKGLDLLLPALSELRDLPWEFTAIGDGPERSALERQACRCSIAERIRFVGWQRGPELDKYYREANLFVLPSRHEGMPNVVLEAMASGLPVLATRIAGSEELVLPGETGELVEPEDASILMEALRSLLLDASLRQRLGEAGRSRVMESFTWSSTAHQYLNLLQSIQGR